MHSTLNYEKKKNTQKSEEAETELIVLDAIVHVVDCDWKYVGCYNKGLIKMRGMKSLLVPEVRVVAVIFVFCKNRWDGNFGEDKYPTAKRHGLKFNKDTEPL